MGESLNFLNPALLWWTAPVVGAILALYLLKMRRRELRIPASFLWPRRVEEIRANSLFQRLRFSWILLLQILCALLACLALARPQVVSKGLQGRSTVIVVDSSLTMGATDVKPSRLEVAKEKAREIVNAAPVGERIAVIDAGVHPAVVSPLGHDPAGEIRAINSIGQSDAPPTVGEALRIGAALVGTNSSGRIVLLSDGCFGQITNFTPGKASVAFESIGSRDDDVSFSAFGTSESKTGRALYVAVHNAGGEPKKVVVNLFADERADRSESVTVPLRGEWSKTYPLLGNEAIVRGEIQTDDALAADNQVITGSKKGGSLRVLLVTQDDPFTEKALALDPRVTLDKSNDIPPSELTPGNGRYDLIVFDGVAERKVNSGAVLVLGGALRTPNSVRNPQFVSQEKDPILDAVDFSQVEVASGRRLPSGGKILAKTSAGPELLAFEETQRKIVLGFNPLDSNFPLQPSFPIFIANCLTFLSASQNSGPLVIAPGRPFAVRAAGEARLFDPDRHETRVKSVNGLAQFPGVGRIGRYRLEADGKSRDIYCSLEPKPVSILPVPQLLAGNSRVTSSAAALSALDIWKYFGFALLVLLLFEWLFYARRS